MPQPPAAVLALLVASLSASSFFGHALHAENAEASDWPGFRGSGQQATVASTLLPDPVPSGLTRSWSVAVGQGDSSPVISSGVVFSHSGQDGQETVTAINIENGEVLWRRQYARAPVDIASAARKHAGGAQATPFVSAERLFILGLDGVLRALDRQDGSLRWSRDLPEAVSSSTTKYGVAASPLLTRDGLIVVAGNHQEGALLALEPGTGKERWRSTMTVAYSSPASIEHAASRSLALLSHDSLVVVDAETGEREGSLTFKGGGFAQNIVTPLAIGEDLIIGGDKRPMMRVALGSDELEILWQNEEVALDMSSPVLSGGRIVGLSARKKGQLFSIDADSGKVEALGEPRAGDHASLVAFESRGVVAVLTVDGQLSFVSSETLETLSSFSVSESAVYAHPVFVEGGVLIKDQSSLSLFRWDQR